MPVFSAATAEVVKANVEATGGGGYLNTKDIPDNGSVRFTLLGCDGAEEGSFAYYEIWAESLNERGKDGQPVRKGFRFGHEPTSEEVNERLESEGFCRSTNKFGKVEELKLVLAFYIWNYEKEAVQVFNISQKNIQAELQSAFADEEVAANPNKWDLELTKKTGGKFVDYSMQLRPGKRANKAVDAQVTAAFDAIQEAGGQLSALLVGGSPFEADKKVPF